MPAHIFIDNSNMLGGATRFAATAEPQVPWQAIRLYFRNFAQLIEAGHTVHTRVLGGSLPPGNDALWDHARNQGYDTSLLQKIETNDGRLIEQGVDEILHLKIANLLLDLNAPQTLILGTGDGNLSDFQTSFEQQVRRALKRGWEVEIWSWSEQLSGKFSAINVNGRWPRINTLDEFYESITFVKGGEWSLPGGTRAIADRIVTPLRIGG